MYTLIGFAATAIVFFILGVTVEMVVATAVISRLINRSQRQIRHWQDEAHRVTTLRP